MNRRYGWLPTLCLLLLPAAASAHGVHEHGAATLSIAVDGDRLTLRFESPLDNLVGFEAAPRNDRQRAAVRRMAERFHRPATLFEPTAAAGCTAASVKLGSDVIPADLLSGPVDRPTGGPTGAPAEAPKAAASAAPATSRGGKGHADLDADIVFVCARPRELAGLRVRLFDAFPSVRRIDAAVATGKGQSGARLSAKQSTLSW